MAERTIEEDQHSDGGGGSAITLVKVQMRIC